MITPQEARRLCDAHILAKAHLPRIDEAIHKHAAAGWPHSLRVHMLSAGQGEIAYVLASMYRSLGWLVEVVADETVRVHHPDVPSALIFSLPADA